MNKKPRAEDKSENLSFPLRMPRALKERVAEGAKRTNLSESDFMRLSIERGAELLIRALTMSPEQLAALPTGPAPEAFQPAA